MRMRAGDLMVTTLTQAEPAVLDYGDLLDATRIVPDDSCDPPWKTCDGLDHHLVTDETDGKASGSFAGDRHCRQRVILDHPERWGNFGWHRARGASKQVAFELTRQEWQRTREYLANLRENGWTVSGVVCNYCGEHASLWGIEATNPPSAADNSYLESTRRELASMVAHALEQVGYTVVNQPNAEAEGRETAKLRIKGNVHGQDWK
jgi:hypothetical protein